MSFVKFTLGDIRTQVKLKLPDAEDAAIDQAANDFQFEVFNDNRIRFMEKAATLAVSQGATTKDLPSDFMTLIMIIVLDTATQFRDITKTGFHSYKEFMANYANYTVAPASQIFDFTLYGEGLRFAAPTKAAYNVNIDYLRSPALMVNAGDNCELPISSRELMTLGTLERLMRSNEDLDESDFEFDRLQGLRTAFIRNWARGTGNIGTPMVLGSGRGRRSYRQGEDM